MALTVDLPQDFPGVLWRRVETVLREFIAAPGERPLPSAQLTEDPEEVAEEITRWLEGRTIEDLEHVLDTLREQGAYPVSLHVLESAWNSDLPSERLGRIAEDWVCTVLRGLGDRAGALVVAQHLIPRAKELGPTFAGDLGHLMLDLGLYEVAADFVLFAAEALPGDTALQYALGVVHKFAGRFERSRAAFERVLAVRPDETAAWYNLGIAHTALKDWPAARHAWGKVGFTLPEGDGDFAIPGDRCVLQLPTDSDLPNAPPHELVIGVRLCPARARLLAPPAWAHEFAAYGDVVLIDGESLGELPSASGEPLMVLRVLQRLGRYGGQRLLWTAPAEGPTSRTQLSQAVRDLVQAGWPVSDYTGQLTGPDILCLALHLPPDRAASAAAQAIARFAPDLHLRCPEAEALIAQEQHADPPPPTRSGRP